MKISLIGFSALTVFQTADQCGQQGTVGRPNGFQVAPARPFLPPEATLNHKSGLAAAAILTGFCCSDCNWHSEPPFPICKGRVDTCCARGLSRSLKIFTNASQKKHSLARGPLTPSPRGGAWMRGFRKTSEAQFRQRVRREFESDYP